MKKLCSVMLGMIMVMASLFSFVGCSASGSDLEYIKNKGVLRVGVTVYDPMDFYDENDNWVGFDADLAGMFAEELGVEVKFVLITWSQKVMELDSKEIDCIWNGMTIGEELGQKIDFSLSYATNMQCAVIRKNSASAITSAEDIKNAKVTCEAGSAGYSVCKDELGFKDDSSSFNPVKAQINTLTEVKSGASDVAIIDYTLAYKVVGKGDYSDLMVVDIQSVAFGKEEFGIGLRKGSDLTEKANAFLKAKYADGTMTSLIEKYGDIALNDAALA